MSTETARGFSDHVRGITVTTLACLAGLVAALVSSRVVGTTPEAATDPISLAIVAVAIAVQYPILHVLGVDVDEFGIKDNLFVGFMTFALWFIGFAVLLSSGPTV